MLLTYIKQHLSLISSFCLFLSGRFTQVLLYFAIKIYVLSILSGRFARVLLYFVIKIFVLSIFEWPFYTGFT